MKNKSRKYGKYFFGAMIGSVIGILAVLLMDKFAELNGEDTILSRKKISKIGLGTISMLWSLIQKDNE